MTVVMTVVMTALPVVVKVKALLCSWHLRLLLLLLEAASEVERTSSLGGTPRLVYVLLVVCLLGSSFHLLSFFCYDDEGL